MEVATQDSGSLEARKQRIRLPFEEIITHNRLELADHIFAPDFYWPQFDLRGPEGVRIWVRSFREAFPDVLDMVQEQIVIITRVKVVGTQLGPFRGLPPSEKKAEFMAVGIDRFEGNKVIERTALFDIVDLMRQLGHKTLNVPDAARP